MGHPGFLVEDRGLDRVARRFMEGKQSFGFAHRFRPTYAGANVGHPSSF
jgi:hypothetical protein